MSEDIYGVLCEISETLKRIANSLDTKVVEKTITKGTSQPKNTTEIEHDGYTYKGFKLCKYECGNLVSWNKDQKKFQHFDYKYNPIGELGECPKYAK